MACRLHRAIIVVGLALGALATGADARTFRWANDGDANSMDSYARQETFLLLMDMSFYEPLVRRDRTMKLEPGLATEWRQTDPTTWRFNLRRGVKFHDGSPFTADDVAFSFDRATYPGSNVASPLATVQQVKKIDDFTVDFVTDGPDPILPYNLPTIAMMSQKWCAEHNTARAADLTKNEESYATRNENGTGPFLFTVLCSQSARLTGASRTSRSMSTRSSSVGSRMPRPGSLRCSRANSTWSIPSRRRTSTA
jgi:peptide/nickel transport system substrate-binding protein